MSSPLPQVKAGEPHGHSHDKGPPRGPYSSPPCYSEGPALPCFVLREASSRPAPQLVTEQEFMLTIDVVYNPAPQLH